MKSALGMIQNPTAARDGTSAIRKELLFALESARTRLAIAIAEETKLTPRDRWQFYLDTTDHVRRFIGKLRKWDADEPPQYEEWAYALVALRQLPIQGSALRLCEALLSIVNELE